MSDDEKTPDGWTYMVSAALRDDATRIEYRHITDLRFCCLDVNDQRHPQVIMKSLGITYEKAIPQSIADQWWFLGCTVPEGMVLPSYLKPMDLPDDERKHWLEVKDDVVDNLRRLGSGFVGTISTSHLPLVHKAADEIERLRAALLAIDSEVSDG